MLLLLLRIFLKKRGGKPRKVVELADKQSMQSNQKEERANDCSELTERDRQRESEEQKARTIKNGRAERERVREKRECAGGPNLGEAEGVRKCVAKSM